MRSTQTCPKCSGKRFAVAKEFRQGAAGSGRQDWTVPFHAIAVPTSAVSADEENSDGARKTGHFKTWICLDCGYTEFYAYGLAGIHELADKYPDRLSIVDATPTDGPYR
jgi:predicted nucleic-acid-binding Zn-ribbon protein